MNRSMQFAAASVLAAVVMFAMPSAAAAQVSADAGKAFIGEWHLPLDVMGQPVQLQLDIEEADGMLEVEVAREDGTETEVEDVKLTDGTLVLNYSVNMQGQDAPISIRLTPAGDDLDATLDVAGGMLTADGTATRD